MGEETPKVEDIVPSITTNGLHYKFPDGSKGLTDINLDLPAGSRTLLIGGMQKLRDMHQLHINLLQSQRRRKDDTPPTPLWQAHVSAEHCVNIKH